MEFDELAPQLSGSAWQHHAVGTLVMMGSAAQLTLARMLPQAKMPDAASSTTASTIPRARSMRQRQSTGLKGARKCDFRKL